MSLGDLVAHADQFLTSKVANSPGEKVGDLGDLRENKRFFGDILPLQLDGLGDLRENQEISDILLPL